MQKITPCLWFDGQAEDAARFYTAVFPGSRIVNAMRGPDGRAVLVRFQLQGEDVLALNGGPRFHFSEAISLVVDCTSQEEVDHYWTRLTEGGEESMCGWLKDRYGLSWQIIPRHLPELLQHPDAGRAGRVMNALLQMRRIDVAALERAAAGEETPVTQVGRTGGEGERDSPQSSALPRPKRSS